MADFESYERSDRDIRKLLRHKTFVVTSAQNNTMPEADFLTALERYCTAHDAALIVRPIRYINPTSKLDPQDEGDDVAWAPELEPYLVTNEMFLGPVMLPDVPIQATARNPLASLQSLSRDKSAIFGSSQLAMQSIATPHNRLPKLLYSTGSVTEKNYGKSKVGRLAKFHHSHSAVVVELRGKRFHLREITWDGERFIDLGQEWTECDTAQAHTLAVATGDEHTWFGDEKVKKATYGRGGIVEFLQPDYLIRHDLTDSYSVSHHHMKNAITRIVKAVNGFNDLRAELQHAVDHLNETTPSGVQNIIVSSNHNDHITQWLRGGERGVEPVNAELYHWFMYQILQDARMTKSGVQHPDPLELFCRGKLECDTRFLTSDESFRLAGVELGMHGHQGPNGSRGSLRSLSVIGSRFIIGHSHSPGIFEGGYQVGTSSVLRMEYNGGPSSWMQTHAALYENGKRQLIHVIDGHWRG